MSEDVRKHQTSVLKWGIVIKSPSITRLYARLDAENLPEFFL